MIGIGRVKTPTLAIACRREIEIRDFVPVAFSRWRPWLQADSGRFRMRHAPKERIVERGKAQAVLEAARDFEGPLGVRVGGQAPATAPAARPSLAPEAVQHALRLDGDEDAGHRPGAL